MSSSFVGLLIICAPGVTLDFL